MPAGEVFISPELGASRGTIVFDGSISSDRGEIMIKRPIRCTVEGGFVQKVSGGGEARRLRGTLERSVKKARSMVRDGSIPEGRGKEFERNTYNLMPVYARRRNFLLQPVFIRVHNYGEERVKRYVEIYEEFFAPDPIPQASIEYLAVKGKPYYVVLWNEDAAACPWLMGKFESRPDLFTLAFENTAGAVFHLAR